MTNLKKVQLEINELEEIKRNQIQQGLNLWKKDENRLKRLILKKEQLEKPKESKIKTPEQLQRARDKSKEWRKKNFIRQRWISLKNRQTVTISWDDFYKWWNETPDICEYCGITIDKYLFLKEKCESIKNKSTAMKQLLVANTMSVERIDSDRGYDKDNIVKACMICNATKGSNIDYDDYKLIAKSVMMKLVKKIKVGLD